MLKKTLLSLLLCFVCSASFLGDFGAHEEFSQWKYVHNKEYDTEEEHHLRMAIFIQNKAEIEDHNSKGKQYTKTLNKWSDLTHQEWKAQFLGSKLLKPETINHTHLEEKDVEKSFDWRDQKAVTPVKEQGSCGSCYTFSATGALEGLVKLSANETKSFSEQQLVDCSLNYGNEGCEGGYMTQAWDYVNKHGLHLEEEYPYKGAQEKCHTKDIKALTGIKYVELKPHCNQLLQAIQINPVSVAVNADSWNGYRGGIYNDDDRCSDDVNHGVLLVGYGTDENGRDYWTIKNSWGPNWGEDGYIRLARNTENEKGTCSVCTLCSYPKHYLSDQ